jgi:hypothetical protein
MLRFGEFKGEVPVKPIYWETSSIKTDERHETTIDLWLLDKGTTYL